MPLESIKSCRACGAKSPRLTDGIILVDKISGPTSHEVVGMARKAFGVRRVGHCGTLDPFATGLLILLVGRATRLSRFLLDLPKRYTGTILLGTVTDTDDITGTVLSAHEVDVADSSVREAMNGLKGRYLQTPPDYSAKKIGGVPAYRRVRRGEEVRLAPAEIEVSEFEMLERNGQEIQFIAGTGSGAYIRALARDVGERLGCGACLKELRRTRIGDFDVGEAVAADVLSEKHLRPLASAVSHLPRISLNDGEKTAITNGKAVNKSVAHTGNVALVSAGDLVAVAESDGSVLKPRIVFN